MYLALQFLSHKRFLSACLFHHTLSQIFLWLICLVLYYILRLIFEGIRLPYYSNALKNSQVKKIPKSIANRVLKKSQYTQFVIFNIISENIRPCSFQDINIIEKNRGTSYFLYSLIFPFTRSFIRTSINYSNTRSFNYLVKKLLRLHIFSAKSYLIIDLVYLPYLSNLKVKY